jgi:aldehyde dehydrogenase (NAD+)
MQLTIPAVEVSSVRLDCPQARLERVFAAQRRNRHRLADSSAAQRRTRLKRLLAWIRQHRGRIQAAHFEDFGKPAAEVDLTEILVVTTEIRHALRQLKRWMRPRPVSPPLVLATTRAWVQYEARGLVLVIAPWNYPFNLALGPLVSALAAGNCVILKPSEKAPAVSRLLTEMLAEIFPETEVAVFEGGPEVARQLLAKPFDHLFFTGSAGTGQQVAQAALAQGASCTLELGGKSPVIIDASADVADAAAKVAWGKYLNAGQSCIAPDHVYVHQSLHDNFVAALCAQLARFGGGPDASEAQTAGYARIIDDHHYRRLRGLIDDALARGARLETGGNGDPARRLMPPTVLSRVTADCRLMQQEIFGPVLPVMPFSSLPVLIERLRESPKPLALYLFARRRQARRQVLSGVPAGTTCVNETMLQFLHPGLPFGGLNRSGQGYAHGWYGFRTFSHERAVLSHRRLSPLKLLYPPYSRRVGQLISWLLRWF